jgi:glycyl-tRNA synthetase beta chain
VEPRRHKIRKALDHVTRTVPGLRWREDHALVDAVTHLTEWPDVLLGTFEPAYLTLPEEVLVTVMRDHQKYFAVEDAAGKLAPYFLTVTNIALDETNTPIIKQGNERVLRARFNDARFFWDFDQKITLQDRVKLLENVTFQKDLGSYAAKSERVRKLAARLAKQVPGVDADAVDLAARLAKTDLTTELVKEFTELQGVIGGLYAASQGVSEVAAYAIYDQYAPASMEDGVPRSREGAVLGIADRADTLASMFGLGMEPTGSKDPFALRRAANGIVKILVETKLALFLSDICEYAGAEGEIFKRLRAFMTERVSFYLREVRGFPQDVVAAVLAAGSGYMPSVIARAEAITAMRDSKDFMAVSAAFKRMRNILEQAGFSLEEGSPYVDDGVPVEAALCGKFMRIHEALGEVARSDDYTQALTLIATLRPEIDAFFEGVMINDPDPAVRRNRLTLLAMIQRSFSAIADFSEIVTAG